MNYVITPNMLLREPIVGVDPGPDFATDINVSLTLIDQHDHTSGKGVAITAAALNINTNLSMNNHFLTNIAGLSLTGQSSTPTNGTIYQSASGFLYYVDQVSGTNIQITNSSGIAAAGGAIAGLVAPASATYVPISSTFIWQSDVNTPANMDSASLIIRNPGVANSNAATLKIVSALASNYNITLPVPSGGGLKLLQMDSSGNITSTLAPDGTTIIYSGSVLSVGTIAGSQISGSITTATLPAASITGSIAGTQLQSAGNLPGNWTTSNLGLVTTMVGSTALSVVRGSVNSSGAGIGGEGFTCTPVSTGSYTVAFVTPFADTPSIMITSNTLTFVVMVTAPTSSGFAVTVYRIDGSVSSPNGAFSFLAIGRRV